MSSRCAPVVVAVADVVAAHGLRGLVRVRPYQPPAPSLAPGRTVLLERAGERRDARITRVAPHGRQRLLVGLDGVADRTAAEALAGARILVRTEDLPAPDAGEFYYHEVLDFAVVTTAGEPLGRIAATFSTGLHDVWVVREEGREALLPVVADVVRTIDRAARRVIVHPLPGLLD